MTVPLDDTRPTDWTPERHAAAKVRDAEAPKGPWGVFEQDCLCWITGPTCIIGNEGQMSRSVAAFVAHAREDLPAALVEIERLTAELAARAPADCDHRAGGEVSIAGTCADCGVDFADLPDVAPADASLEAAERTWRGEWQRIAADIRSMSEAGKTPADILAILLTHLDRMKPLAVVRAVDASRPERTFPRVTLDKVAPGSLVEIASRRHRHRARRARATRAAPDGVDCHGQRREHARGRNRESSGDPGRTGRVDFGGRKRTDSHQ